MRNGEEVKLYLSKMSEMIYMLSIAGRKCRKVIGPHHLSLTYGAGRLIRYAEATHLRNANDNN